MRPQPSPDLFAGVGSTLAEFQLEPDVVEPIPPSARSSEIESYEKPRGNRSADTSAVLPISAVQVPGQRTNGLMPRDLPAAPLDSQDTPSLVLASRLNGIKCLI